MDKKTNPDTTPLIVVYGISKSAATSMLAPSSELVSGKEAARILGVHPNTSSNVIRRKQVAYVRVGVRGRRVRRSEVVRIVEHGI
jgi:excisionase family DNA binding protein